MKVISLIAVAMIVTVGATTIQADASIATLAAKKNKNTTV